MLEQLARHEGPPRDQVPVAPRPAIGDRPLVLSYGAAQDYLECPARYRYGHVVRIPTPASHQMVYGKALHAAVQAYHRRQMAGRPMTEDDLHAALDRAWESVGFLTREHEEARRAAAHEAVARFWADQQREPARPVAVEQEFTVGFGRDRLRGRYDRVDRDEAGRVVITDYKSSDVRDLATATRRARESLQLSIYALAHEAQHGALPDELALHFLESGIVGRVAPSERQLTKAHDQLSQAAEGIRAGHFEPTPSPMRCGYCPSARSAPTPRDERPNRAIVVGLILLGVLTVLLLLVFAAGRVSGGHRLRPCAEAPRNVVIVIGLAAMAAALLVTPFAFLGEVIARRRIVYRGAWSRAARRGVLVGLVLATLAGLRLGDALSVPIAIFVVILAGVAEWFAARRDQ